MTSQIIFIILYSVIGIISFVAGVLYNLRCKKMIKKYKMKNGVFTDQMIENKYKRFNKRSNFFGYTMFVVILMGGFYLIGQWSLLITACFIGFILYAWYRYKK